MTIRVVQEHDSEPIPGLPRRLPPGERILWRGRPRSRLVARNVFKTHWIAGYFLALTLLVAGNGLIGETPAASWIFSVGIVLLLGAIVIGIAEVTAWAIHKTTLYTITSKRLVLRVGVALSVTVNIPFAQINAVERRRIKDDCGDVAITLSNRDRISWLMLWPHVRVWRLRHPSPVLRCVPHLDKVCLTLTDALRDFALRDENGSAPAMAADTPSARPAVLTGAAVAAERVPS